MWEEIELNEKGETIEIKAEPAQDKKPSLLSKVLPLNKPAVLKAAFVYDVPPSKSGWVNDHELGRKHAQTALGEKVETSVYIMEDIERLPEVLEKAVSDNNKLIFTTSPRMLKAALKSAVEHPDVTVMNCSLNISHRYVRTYYTRMYEVKFILGALAGSLTRSDRLGYICDYPIYGQIAGINAFALGAQMANPRAKVFLEWSSVKGAKEAALSLTEQQIHIISSLDSSRFLEDNRISYGLSHIENGNTNLLATPVMRWGVYYEKILRSALSNTIQSEYAESDRALNYYWGMSAGVVDIKYAPDLPLPSRRYADFFRDSLIRGAGRPFLTPFLTQSGEIIGYHQRELSLNQIINIDYLVDNVVGSIPTYDEMNTVGQTTVDMVGVNRSKQDVTEAIYLPKEEEKP
jgi:basic membrane lipoprotein Med (substrate-binding protein (PBP1-ABC) superfamily)